MILEAICDHRKRILHAFFGTPGSNNNVNIVNNSPLLKQFHIGAFPPSEFTYNLNGQQHIIPYFLSNGIYPSWRIFASSIKGPKTASEKQYTAKHESVRKDIERAFGELKKRFGILKSHSRLHPKGSMYNIMYC